MHRAVVTVACIGAVIAMVSVPQRSPGQDQGEVLRRVMADWKKRRDTYRTLRCTVNGEKIVPKGHLTGVAPQHDGATGEVPPVDYHSPVSVVMTMDFAKKCFSKTTDEEDYFRERGRFIRGKLRRIHDGEIFSAISLESDQPTGEVANIVKGGTNVAPRDIRVPFFDREYPFLFACGYFLSDRDPRRLEVPSEDRFSIQGFSRHEDRQCVVLRSTPRQDNSPEVNELWVDPGKESAIVRWLCYQFGKIDTAMEIDYEWASQGWMPKEWRSSVYYEAGTGKKGVTVTKLGGSDRIAVTELIVNPELKADEFQINPSPGMIVLDRSEGDKLFQAENDGSLTPISVGPNGEIRKDRQWAVYILGIGLVAVIGVSIVVLRRRRAGRERR